MTVVPLAMLVFEDEDTPHIEFVEDGQQFAWRCQEEWLEKLATLAVPPEEGNTPDIPCFPKHQVQKLQRFLNRGGEVLTCGENIPEAPDDGRIY